MPGVGEAGAADIDLAAWQNECRLAWSVRNAAAARRGAGLRLQSMVVEFTMLNQDKVILCAISTVAMDDLEGRHDLKAEERLDQFMRLRAVIEGRASHKFFEEQAQAIDP